MRLVAAANTGESFERAVKEPAKPPNPFLPGLQRISRIGNETDAAPQPPTLLIVEDDPIDVLAVQRTVVEQIGWRVHSAPSLAAARAMLRHMKFEAVLMDLELGDGRGTELLTELIDLPVVFLTGTGDERTAVETMKAGAVDYLVKDVQLEYLAQLPRRLLEARERHAILRLERQLSTVTHVSAEKLRDFALRFDDLLWIQEPPGELSFVSPLALEVFGVAVESLRTDTWMALVPQEWRTRVAQARAGVDPSLPSYEYPIDHPRRGVRWLHERRFAVRDESGKVVRVVGVTRDVTEQRQAEHALRRRAEQAADLALRDPLTGLWNRRGVEDLLDREIRIGRRSDQRICLVLVDCDNFKSLNDHFGHDAGDTALQEIAVRIRASLRPADVVGRVGGDEFLVILPDTRPGEAQRVAERIRDAIAHTPIRHRDLSFEATVSIGVAPLPVPLHTCTPTEARTLADAALNSSKRAGRNRVTLADPTANGVHGDPSLLLGGAGFRCAAQPIRNLRDRSLVGYEMLTRGPVGCESPAVLFALAAAHDRIVELDRICLRNALEAGRRLRAEHGEAIHLHVNARPCTLLEMSDLEWRTLLDGLPTDHVCIEVCEQDLIGVPVDLRLRIDGLRDLGAKIALDDVGFGKSCLEALLLLEPDVIKLDRALVQDCDTDESRRRMLARMRTLATTFGAVVVPEGIETAGELGTLLDLGFEIGQGYLLGRPAFA